MQRVLSHLRVRSGHDFSSYKKATIRRRIARRMQVQRAATMTDYLGVLRENPQEAQALFADLLISVTMFFRDAKAFEKLAALAIPRLFEDKGAVAIRSVSGSPAAPQAKKPTRLRSCCLKKRAGTRSDAGFRSLLPISMTTLWRSQGRVVTPPPSKPT